MHEAVVGDRLFTPEAFTARFGALHPDANVTPLCPRCGGAMKLVRISWGRERFSHDRPRADCPLVIEPRADILRPRAWDFGNAEARREAFLSPLVFKRAKGFFAYCVGSTQSIEHDSNGAVLAADRRNIWAWADLPLWATPYVLLTLVDWSVLRLQCSVRFRILRPRYGTIDGLWLEPRECVLSKTHADTGKRVADDRFPMNVLPFDLVHHSPSGGDAMSRGT
jgi:hypothetical protein